MSMGNLLMRYIRLAVQEARLARVPNQLVSTDTNSGNSDDENLEQELDEFCGIGGGGIVGYNGPLGAANPQVWAGSKKRKKKRRK